MRKKVVLAILAGLMAMSLGACQATSETAEADISAESKEQTENTEQEVSKQSTEEAETEETLVGADQGSLTTYSSSYGYTIEYDASLFEVTNDEGMDCIQLIGQDLEKETPVYLAVTLIEEESAAIIAEGIALQSGSDDTKIEDATVGKEAYTAQKVVYQQEAEAGNITNVSYVLEVNGKVFLVEQATGTDTSADIQSKMEEMVGSFFVTEDGNQ